MARKKTVISKDEKGYALYIYKECVRKEDCIFVPFTVSFTIILLIAIWYYIFLMEGHYYLRLFFGIFFIFCVAILDYILLVSHLDYELNRRHIFVGPSEELLSRLERYLEDNNREYIRNDNGLLKLKMVPGKLKTIEYKLSGCSIHIVPNSGKLRYFCEIRIIPESKNNDLHADRLEIEIFDLIKYDQNLDMYKLMQKNDYRDPDHEVWGIMDEGSFAIKSSPLWGFINLGAGIALASFALSIVLVVSSEAWFSLVILALAMILIVIGYDGVMSIQTFFINENGIILKKKNDIEFFLKWDEISKIRSYKQPGGDFGPYRIIRLFCKNKRTVDIGFFYDSWSTKAKKMIFRELVKYIENHEFVVEDELHWAS